MNLDSDIFEIHWNLLMLVLVITIKNNNKNAMNTQSNGQQKHAHNDIK